MKTWVERMYVVKTWIWLAMVLGTGMANADVLSESAALLLTIDDVGRVVGLMDKANQAEYVAPDQESPLTD